MNDKLNTLEDIMSFAHMIVDATEEESKLRILFLKTLTVFMRGDYKKIRLFITDIFKRTYNEENYENLMNELAQSMDDQENGAYVDQDHIDDLISQIGEIPYEIPRSDLDYLETIDKFIDKLDNKKKQGEVEWKKKKKK